MKLKKVKSLIALLLSLVMLLSLLPMAALATAHPGAYEGENFNDKLAYLNDLQGYIDELDAFLNDFDGAANPNDASASVNSYRNGINSVLSFMDYPYPTNIITKNLLNVILGNLGYSKNAAGFSNLKNDLISDALVITLGTGLVEGYSFEIDSSWAALLSFVGITIPTSLTSPVEEINQMIKAELDSIADSAYTLADLEALLDLIDAEYLDASLLADYNAFLAEYPTDLEKPVVELEETDVTAQWDAVKGYRDYAEKMDALYDSLNTAYGRQLADLDRAEMIAEFDTATAVAKGAIEAFLPNAARLGNGFDTSYLNNGLAAIDNYLAEDADGKFALIFVDEAYTDFYRFVMVEYKTAANGVDSGNQKLNALDANIVQLNEKIDELAQFHVKATEVANAMDSMGDLVKSVLQGALGNAAAIVSPLLDSAISSLGNTVVTYNVADISRPATGISSQADYAAANTLYTTYESHLMNRIYGFALNEFIVNTLYPYLEPIIAYNGLEKAIEDFDYSSLDSTITSLETLRDAYTRFDAVIQGLDEDGINELLDLLGMGLAEMQKWVGDLLDAEVLARAITPLLNSQLGISADEEDVAAILEWMMGLVDIGAISEQAINLDYLKSVSAAIPGYLQELIDFLSEVQRGVDRVTDAINKVEEAKEKAEDWLNNELPALLDQLEQKVKDKAEEIVTQIGQEAYDKLKEELADLRQEIQDIVDDIDTDSIIETIQKIREVVGKIRDIIEKLEALHEIIDNGALKDFVDAIIDELEEFAKDSIINGVQEIKDAVRDWIENELCELIAEIKQDLRDYAGVAAEQLIAELERMEQKLKDIYNSIDTDSIYETLKKLCDTMEDIRDFIEDSKDYIQNKEYLDTIQKLIDKADKMVRDLENVTLVVDYNVAGNDGIIDDAEDNVVLRVNYQDLFTYTNWALDELQALFDRYHIPVDLGNLDVLDLFVLHFSEDIGSAFIDSTGYNITVKGVAPLARVGSELTDASVEYRDVVVSITLRDNISAFLKAQGISNPDNIFADESRTVTIQVKLEDMPVAPVMYTVIFDSQGGSSVSSAAVEDGTAAVKPSDPIRNGYSFDGWYTQAQNGSLWNFATPVTADMTLYARWSSTGGGGGGGGGGGRTTAPTEIGDEETPLSDLVAPFIQGRPDGKVYPEAQITRAEVAMILYTLYAEANVTYAKAAYNDMDETHWASDAIGFATEKSFVKGYPDGSFQPNAPISRAELANVLYNVKQYTGTSETTFSDVMEGYWAYNAINALTENGLITGYADGTFRPGQSITRAEAVAIFCRAEERDPSAYDTVKTFPDLKEDHWAYGYMMNATNGVNYFTSAEGTENAENEEAGE